MCERFEKGKQFGPYILEKELGRGSSGIVWLAKRQADLTTTYFALKFPLDPEVDVNAIRKVAERWVLVSGHPNVIPVFEAAIDAGEIFIVSEYAPEGTLKKWLHHFGGKAPDVHSAVTMCSGILAGLDHLHSRDLLHRDLKPANILLQGGLPRITDFDQARVLLSAASTQGIAGSPAYMAPETWRGDRRLESDIWSVGVILYEMLAGRRPFHATSVHDFAEVVRREEFPPVPDSVPDALRDVVARALEKQWEHRFGSAREMHAALLGRPGPADGPDPSDPPSNPLLAAEIDKLVEQLHGASPQDRIRAARELGRLGRGVIVVARALCKACDDPAALVRDAVVKALREILEDDSDAGRKLRADVVAHLRAMRGPNARHCMNELGIR